LFNDAKTSSSDIASFPVNNKILQNPITKYVSTFSIFSLDEYNNKIIDFSYKNAFPTSLSEINFSNQDPSEITCTATFSFNQLEVSLLGDVNKVNC
jgi:hypothetical protein